jgi:multiple sugar transport system substrate-binding protein
MLKKILTISIIVVFITTLGLTGAGCKTTTSDTTTSVDATEADETTTAVEDETTTAVETETTTTSEEKIKLVFANWASAEEATRETINAVMDEFIKLHPNVTFENLAIPYTMVRDQLITMAAGGNSPDVMQLNGNWPFELGSMGALMDLNEIAEPEYLADNYEGGLAIGTYEGKLYAVPYALTSHGFWYNKDIMVAAGIKSVPKTMDELMDASKKIKDVLGAEGVYALGIDTTKIDYSLIGFIPWMWTFGATPLEGGVNFNTPENKKAFEWLREIVKEEYNPVGLQIKDLRELMAKDKVAFKIDGPYCLGIFRSLNPELEGDVFFDKFGVTTTPMGDVSSPQILADIHNLGISTQCDNKEMAWEFVKFLASSDISITTYLLPMGAVLPLKSKNTEYSSSFDNDVMKPFIEEVMPNMRAFPFGPKYGSASQFIISAMQETVTTDKSIDNILADCEANLKILYGEE